MSDIWLKRLKSLEDALEKNIVRTNIVVGSFGKIEYILDFSARDKMFKNKIADLESLLQKQEEFLDMKNIQIDELKQRIAELESKEMSDLPFAPLECANYLINATYERETNGIERAFHNLPEKVNSDRYTVDDLEQIAEHLLVYCKHNKERDNEKEI